MKTYPALVLGGYSPDKPDPLALAVGAERKSLIDVAGKPMIYWIVRALAESKRVDDITIVGLSPEDNVDFGVEVTYVPNQASHIDNIMSGVKALKERDANTTYAVVASADIPLLQTRTVDWLVDACDKKGGDFFYSIVEQQVMQSQYPGSARSFVPIQDKRYCGGDLFYVDVNTAVGNEELIRDLLDNRKNVLQQVRIAGFGTVIKFLFRRLSLEDAEEVASRLVNCDARVMESPYADLAMDVDKPHQLDMVRQLLGAPA
jgi:GTP:adenosylcobinamide-phosphate guanylyltransferase